jgi:hypothetical protein
MALCAAVSIPAEAAQVKCRVPFSFTVHGITPPPGTYHASTDLGPAMLAIRGERSFAAAIANTRQSVGETEAKLVFYKYGDQYYLREVWLGGQYGRELVRNRPKGEPTKTAEGGTPPKTFEQVVIAAQ